jgi:hypothetical protein
MDRFWDKVLKLTPSHKKPAAPNPRGSGWAHTQRSSPALDGAHTKLPLFDIVNSLNDTCGRAAPGTADACLIEIPRHRRDPTLARSWPGIGRHSNLLLGSSTLRRRDGWPGTGRDGFGQRMHGQSGQLMRLPPRGAEIGQV